MALMWGDLDPMDVVLPVQGMLACLLAATVPLLVNVGVLDEQLAVALVEKCKDGSSDAWLGGAVKCCLCREVALHAFPIVGGGV